MKLIREAGQFSRRAAANPWEFFARDIMENYSVRLANLHYLTGSRVRGLLRSEKGL